MPRENYQLSIVIPDLPPGTAEHLIKIAKDLVIDKQQTENVGRRWANDTNEAVVVVIWRIRVAMTQVQARNAVLEAAQTLCQASGVPFRFEGKVRRVTKVADVNGHVTVR